MAFNTKNFLDIVGLGKYDELIKIILEMKTTSKLVFYSLVLMVTI